MDKGDTMLSMVNGGEGGHTIGIVVKEKKCRKGKSNLLVAIVVVGYTSTLRGNGMYIYLFPFPVLPIRNEWRSVAKPSSDDPSQKIKSVEKVRPYCISNRDWKGQDSSIAMFRQEKCTQPPIVTCLTCQRQPLKRVQKSNWVSDGE